MDWKLAIERNREALGRVIASLVPLAAAMQEVPHPRPLHRFISAVLRPAEAALRRLIVIVAATLATTASHLRGSAGRVETRGSTLGRLACGSKTERVGVISRSDLDSDPHPDQLRFTRFSDLPSGGRLGSGSPLPDFSAFARGSRPAGFRLTDPPRRAWSEGACRVRVPPSAINKTGFKQGLYRRWPVPACFATVTIRRDDGSSGARRREMMLRRLVYLLVLAIFCSAQADTAQARKWKPTETELSQDYLSLDHGLPGNEKILLFWFAPEFFERTDATLDLRKVLDRYMMVGVIHFTMNELGEAEIHDPQAVEVSHNDSGVLQSISREDLPPVAGSIVDLLKQIMSSSMGKIGNGMEIFMFDGNQLDRCVDGIVKIGYRDELYDFETPLPNCE